MAIDWDSVEIFDAWLDANVSQQYKAQPLAQDWARICKGGEEMGESIAELILATAQNPRKPLDPDAFERLQMELADSALTFIYGLQHFTKDIQKTRDIIARAQTKHISRMNGKRA